MRVPALVLAAALALSACGGGDELAPPPADDPASQALVTEGTAVPELLSRFRCAPDEEGAWAAAGRVSNPTKNPVSYQVSVNVGPAEGETTAATTRLEDVAAGETEEFVLTEVPATGPDGPCRVQVLALP